MRRRSLLTTMGAGSLSLAGCAAVTEMTGTDDLADDSSTSETENLPENCPTSQNLGVEWPEQLDESTVVSFVEEYELEYYQQEVIDTLIEPQSRLFAYEGWIGRVETVTETVGGWQAQFEGIVNVLRGDLVLEATTSDPPRDAELIPIGEIDQEQLTEVLNEAADTGQAEQMIGPSQTDEYLDLFGRLSDEFELTHVGDSETLHFSIDGTIVELVVTWFAPNRDHFWNAWYYVDEQVIWRSARKDINPKDGELLECRTSS